MSHVVRACCVAGCRGSANLLSLMIQKGADVNCASNEGWTPLLLAARAGKLDRTQILLTADADVTAKNNQVGCRLPCCKAVALSSFMSPGGMRALFSSSRLTQLV